MKGEVLSDCALLMTADDSVATAIEDLSAGDTIEYEDRTITITQDIPFGHKLALTTIPAGEEIYKYGYVIARATEAIEPGDWVHVHNTESTRGRGDLAAEEQDHGGEPA